MNSKCCVQLLEFTSYLSPWPFSFGSIVVRLASCQRGSPWRQCQPLDIYQAMLSNSFWIHCSSKWCQQNVSRCRGWRIFDLALHYCSPMESMVLSWWEFEERANGSKDEHDDNRNFVSKIELSMSIALSMSLQSKPLLWSMDISSDGDEYSLLYFIK